MLPAGQMSEVSIDLCTALQIPRGLDNSVAIDLITQHIKWRLSERLQSKTNA